MGAPSGKAPVFGVGIRRFESYRPSQIFIMLEDFLFSTISINKFLIIKRLINKIINLPFNFF